MIDKIINDLQRIADRKCYPEDILDGSIAQEWVDYLTNLQQEKQLKETIDKAINYIKNNACYDKETKKCNDDLNYNECDKLLEILGGKE